MAKAQRRAQTRRRVSLAFRLSMLVLFAALLPLAAVVGINDYFARSTLINQSQTTLSSDSASKVALIDRYLQERQADSAALASLVTAPAYLACVSLPAMPYPQAAALDAQLHCSDPVLGMEFYKGSNTRAIAVGIVRDPNYLVWSIFTARGDMLLTCPATGDPRNPCGKAANIQVPKQDLAQVQKNKPFISAVYYQPQGKYAYVNLYTPIGFGGQVLGFEQARLKLDYIWGLVANEKGANGTGSYAFITDENGVRIADADNAGLFHSVSALDAGTLQTLTSEQRFGTTPITQENLNAVTASLKSDAPTDTFQGPAVPGSSVPYQYVRERLANAPWTYFVLSPLSTVTQVADNQVNTSLISAGIVAVLAILLGLMIGGRLTRPVSAASSELTGAAVSLKKLAARQQNSAGEQQWVVDACRTGLESVRYLSDAMNQAARRIIEASNWFGDYWDRLTEEQARRTVQHLLELARYVDEAARRQQASSDRLGKAITVTMQVSDQLATGANAATQSAEQLEQVVTNLQRVVGGRGQAAAQLDDEEFEQMEQMMPMNMPMEPGPMAPDSPFRGGRSGRLAMPAGQQAPRQLMAPGQQPQMSQPGAWGGQQYGGQQYGGQDMQQDWSASNGGYGYQSGPLGGYGEDYGQQQDPWASAGQGYQGQGWNGR